MKVSPASLGQLATVLLSLAPLASAWPSWLVPELDSLVVRQDAGGETSSPAPTAKPTGKPVSSSPNTFNLNTGGKTVTGGDDGGGSKNGTKTSNPAKHTQFNPQDPAGAVVMITPAATAPTQLYKIGETVTWAWNYTNLQGTPTAVDVLASCPVASRTYTLTQNMTFETPGTFTWDTGAFNDEHRATPLLTEEYTLIIYDSDSGFSATPEPGFLGTFQGFRFGVYAKQSYTALSEGWQCASCSAAISDMDKRALGFAFTMCVVTVLSFTWFVTGFAVAL